MACGVVRKSPGLLIESLHGSVKIFERLNRDKVLAWDLLSCRGYTRLQNLDLVVAIGARSQRFSSTSEE